MYFAADDMARTLDAAGNALALSANDEGAAMLALQLMAAGVAEAEPSLSRYPTGKPLPEVRLAYARMLLDPPAQSDAQAQVQAIRARSIPIMAPAAHPGHCRITDRPPGRGQSAVQQFTRLQDGLPASEQRKHALTQSYLLQAQIAEKRGNFAGRSLAGTASRMRPSASRPEPARHAAGAPGPPGRGTRIDPRHARQGAPMTSA